MPRKAPSAGPPDAFLHVIRKFNEKGIRFLIAGARALAFHGYSRFTRDYDICVAPDPVVIDRVMDVMNQLGFQISEPVDAAMVSQAINMHFVSEVDIDLLVRPKGFDFEKAWKNRVTVKEKDDEIHFVSKKDLIAMKVAVGRPQDKVDVEKIK